MTNKPNNICIGQEGSSQQFKEAFKSGDHGGDRKAFLSGEEASPLSEGTAPVGVAEQGENSLGQAVWSASRDQ